jgi:hypothetical protein
MGKKPLQEMCYMKCGYEVPGMILLQAYLYTYSLPRGVTFEVLPMSSYALSSVMLQLLETSLELQLSILSSLFFINIRGLSAEFMDSHYYSESELCGGAVMVSFSKYLP